MEAQRNIADEPFFTKLTQFEGVEHIYLYGSSARGEAGAHSDVDIAIDCPTASAETWNNITQFLEQVPVLDKIDVVRFDTLEEGVFKEQIQRDMVVLYGAE